MEKVRAKFWVTAVTKTARGKGETPFTTVSMQPVYSSDPNSENRKFTEYSPSGSFEMTMSVPESAAFFEIGQEYYLDFVKAPELAA